MASQSLMTLSFFAVCVRGLQASAQCSMNITYGLGYTANGKWYAQNKTFADFSECCSWCSADAKCKVFTFHPAKASKTSECTKGTAPAVTTSDKETVSGSKVPVPSPTPAPPVPPPTPPPSPGPIRPGSPNIVLFLTDDQDVALGGFKPMVKTSKALSARGTTANNWFVHTPVCCPSRTELVTGRYFHNMKVAQPTDKGCMHCKTFDTWADELLFAPHLQKAGYKVGIFGKFLNNGNPLHAPPGVTMWFANGGGNYLNPSFSVDDTEDPATKPAQVQFRNRSALGAAYSTSVIGNNSLAWVKKQLAAQKKVGGTDEGRPFMAYIAPKAPHIQDGAGFPITIPAPWYADEFSGVIAPRTPSWNYSATDHHWMIAQQQPMTMEEADHSDALYRARWQALMSVDDLVDMVVDAIDTAGALNHTYFIYTSDHGFRFGQFRMPQGKWNVYDNNIRIPMVFAGPGLAPGSTFDLIGTNVDIMPTILGLGGVATPATMDGRSIAPELIKPTHRNDIDFESALAESAQTLAHVRDEWQKKAQGARPAWRSDQLIEYYGLGNVVRYAHLEDTYNNTFRALRCTSSSTVSGNSTAFSNVLYAEFTDVRTDYNFTGEPEFYELYDLDADPHMLHNAYKAAPDALKADLHTRLLKLFVCRGNPDSSSKELGGTELCN